jgi:dTDP-4-amino-4,6-dideoxygalactose transaminase
VPEKSVRSAGRPSKSILKAPPPAPTSVPLIDVTRENAELRDEIAAALDQVCDSGRFILGPDCQAFEQQMATLCGAPHAVGCASGSDALLLSLLALDIGPGDEVIVPSYTFYATASAVERVGAEIVFAEIEPAGFNLDPRSVEAAVTDKTRAIIPVHLFGQCAEMDALNDIAKRHDLAVIEDACQAIGADYHGQRAGSLGDCGCFSFYPTKNLGGFGDGGLVTAGDADLARRVRLFARLGMEPRYHHQVLGINSRLDTLQAAVLSVKLAKLDEWTGLRQANAGRYQHLFAEFGLQEVLTLPRELQGRSHVWNQYVVRVPDGRRDALREHLRTRQIGTEIYYPVPLHQQACFADLGYVRGSLPVTEQAAAETLALPIFSHLTEPEQALVVREIAVFYGVATVGRSKAA